MTTLSSLWFSTKRRCRLDLQLSPETSQIKQIEQTEDKITDSIGVSVWHYLGDIDQVELKHTYT